MVRGGSRLIQSLGRSMLRFTLPIIIFSALLTVSFVVSGAPMRVHVLESICLFISIPLTTWVATVFDSKFARIATILIGSFATIVAWDGLAHQVITKADPFFIAKTNPWLYPILSIMLGLINYIVSSIAKRPNQSINNARSAGSDPAASGRSGYVGRSAAPALSENRVKE